MPANFLVGNTSDTLPGVVLGIHVGTFFLLLGDNMQKWGWAGRGKLKLFTGGRKTWSERRI